MTNNKLYLLIRKSILNPVPQVFSSRALAERELCANAYEWHQWDDRDLVSVETAKRFHELFVGKDYQKALEVLKADFSDFVNCYSVVEVDLDDSEFDLDGDDDTDANEIDIKEDLQKE